MQETATGLRLTVRASQLTAAIKAASLGRDKGRDAIPALSDYRLELEGGNLVIVSTDRYKLIKVSILWGSLEGTIDGLSVDGAQLDTIAGHKLAKGHGDTVTLTIDGDGLTAAYSDGTSLRATATGNKFPNYRPIIEMDKGDIAPVIGFTARYLQDVAKACEIVAGKDKGYLTACLGDKTKPATFTATGDGVEITALLMPVRLKD